MCFIFFVPGLGFRVCLCAHAPACICRLEVCVCIQLTCVCKPMYAHTYLCLETLIQVFCFCFFYILCLCFALFACSWVTASLFIYFFALDMTRLGCSLCFLLWYHKHALIWLYIDVIGAVMQQGKWGKSCIGMDLHFYMFVWCLISCLEVWNIYDD